LTPARTCCQLSELLGIFSATRGRVIQNGNGHSAYFSLIRNTVARKVIRLARLNGDIEAKYQAVRGAKEMTFCLELPLPVGMEQAFLQPAPRELPASACDRKALLRGFFLGCGSVNSPAARYHLELSPPTRSWAERLLRLLSQAQIRAGLTERAGHQVVYVKEGDGIARSLSLMGASRAVVEFEKARVVRDVRGQVNRRLNFETANIDKSIGTALRQITAIERLDDSGRLMELPPALREMASMRRANPDLNLNELARRMRLSKSAVNHRLRRLMDLSGQHPN
jgi:DNA-binding protein WhiA